MYYTRSKETVALYDAASWIVITFDFEIIVIFGSNTPFVWSTRLHVIRNAQSSVCHFARIKMFCLITDNNQLGAFIQTHSKELVTLVYSAP